jgi:hypothetical protein
MRFSIFAAFMLPLAALAAPTPQPSSESPVRMAHDKFTAALIETSINIQLTHDKAAGVPIPALVDQTNVIRRIIDRISIASQRIGTEIEGGKELPVEEYVHNPFAHITMGQND